MTDLSDIARDVVMDYADQVCDHKETCDCSMGRLYRAVKEAGKDV